MHAKTMIKGKLQGRGESLFTTLKTCTYRIGSIRRRGYYLFHRAILCGFYSRAVFIEICKGKGFQKTN